MQKTLANRCKKTHPGKKPLQLMRKTPIAVTVAENPGNQDKKHHPRYDVMLSGKESSAPPGTQSTSKIQTFDASIALAQLTDTWSCQRSTCCVMKWQHTFGTKAVPSGILHCMSHQCIWKDKNTNVMRELGPPRFLDNTFSIFGIFSKATFLGDKGSTLPKPWPHSNNGRSTPIRFCYKLAYRIGPNRKIKHKKSPQLWITGPIICIAIFRKDFCIPAGFGSFSGGNGTLKGKSPSNL